jgi:ABC-type tungstate transport system permease subunit
LLVILVNVLVWTNRRMGAALNTTSVANAYVLADRGTWLSFKNHGELDILVEDAARFVQPMRRHPGQKGV